MKKRIIILATVLLAVLVATGCTSGAGELAVIDAWARPGTVGGNSAVYFIIDNPAAEADTLLSVSGDVAERAELHMSKPGANGVMMMEQQETVPVAGDRAVVFAPGGLHVMLIGLSKDLKEGETFLLRLQFEKAGEISLSVPVEER